MDYKIINGKLDKYYGTEVNVTIPDDVRTIGIASFSFNKSIQMVSIHNNIHAIGRSAFYECSNLKKVNIPFGVKVINEDVFLNCGSLESVDLPDSVVRIKRLAFGGCVNLTHIYIPKSVIEIHSSAFEECDKDRLCMFVENDSLAHQFAEKNGFRFVIDDSRRKYIDDFTLRYSKSIMCEENTVLQEKIVEKPMQELKCDKKGINLDVKNLPGSECINKKKVNFKALITCLVSILAGIAIITFIVTLVIIPTNKYNDAMALMNSGNIDGAYLIFEELDNFKNCEELRNKIDYSKAKEFIENDCLGEAYYRLSKMVDSEEGIALMKQLEQTNPYLPIVLSAPGDTVILGEYEQDNNIDNGKEPIEWIVLHNKDGVMYLLSKYVLDAQPFNTSNIKDCSLDDWLKTTFYENAFEAVCEDTITRVELLRRDDIDGYSMTEEQIIGEYTKYALEQNPERGYIAGLMWWLIEDELSTSSADNRVLAPVVWEKGYYDKRSANVTERCGVRPALWIFAEPNDIPSEPVFDGSSPKKWELSENIPKYSYCSRCNGDGKVYDQWPNTHGDGFTCGRCRGDGIVGPED